MKTKKIINKYFETFKNLEEEVVEYETNKLYFEKTMDLSHEMISSLVEETKNYCKKKGYEISSVLFFSAYDADILDVSKEYKRIKFNSESYLSIIKKDNKFVALIFFGSVLEGKENNNE